MLTRIERYAPLVGRILLSLIFLGAGLSKIAGWPGTAAYMASHGMPAIPFFLVAAMVIELAGGCRSWLVTRHALARWRFSHS